MWHNPVLSALTHGYERLIRKLLARPIVAIVPGAIAALLAGVLFVVIGKEFLPELDEGSIWLQVQLPPGVSLQKASDMASELRAAMLEYKREVSHVVTQLGRNDDGTDPWTPSHIECSIGLHPYATWPNGETKHDLIRKLGERFEPHSRHRRRLLAADDRRRQRQDRRRALRAGASKSTARTWTKCAASPATSSTR